MAAQREFHMQPLQMIAFMTTFTAKWIYFWVSKCYPIEETAWPIIEGLLLGAQFMVNTS
jgi:hypothetical protein